MKITQELGSNYTPQAANLLEIIARLKDQDPSAILGLLDDQLAQAKDGDLEAYKIAQGLYILNRKQ